MNEYLDLARQGRNNWWRFVLAVLLILFMWQFLGAMPSLVLMIWSSLTGQAGTDQTVSFIAFMLASICFAFGIFLAVRFIHKRPFLTLVTPARAIDWGRLARGFVAWFTLAGAMSVLEALLYPGRYVLTLDLPRFLPFVFLALILIPIQTSAEELFFRGYLLQGFGLRLRNIWVLCTLSGVFFGLPHLLNPEASLNYVVMGFYYFAMGFFLAYITLKDDRLELALGVHAANNLFSTVFANYTVTVLPTPSLFTVNVLDVGYSVTSALIGMVIFILLFFVLLRKNEQGTA